MCGPTEPCGECGWSDRERLRDDADRVTDYIENENPDLRRFVTLTLPGDGLDAGDTFPEQVPDFRAMVHKLAEKIQDRKGSTEWVGGIEAQENGNPHAHLLVDQYIDRDWLANAWADCGDGADRGGYVKIEYAEGDAEAVGDYIVAYVDSALVVGNI
jgi:hypothetical protein